MRSATPPRDTGPSAREVALGYIFDDVQYPGTITLVDGDAMTTKTPFMEVIDEIVEMHRRKGADYGRADKGDPFANVRASEAFGVKPWIGCSVRMNDKMVRIQAAARGQQLVNESLEDSLLDLATYAIIALCLAREERDVSPHQAEPEEIPAIIGALDAATQPAENCACGLLDLGELVNFVQDGVVHHREDCRPAGAGGRIERVSRP